GNSHHEPHNRRSANQYAIYADAHERIALPGRAATPARSISITSTTTLLAWVVNTRASRSPPIGTGMHANAPGDLLTARGEHPRIGLPLHMPPLIHEQPETLQTTQQLRHLPRVMNPRTIPNLPVAHPRMPPNTLEHPHSAI